MRRKMSFNRTFKCIISFTLVFVFLFSSAAIPNVFATDSLEDLQAQYDKLQDKIAQSEEKLNGIQSNIDSQYSTIQALDGQIGDVSSQVDLISKKLNLINDEIAKIDAKKQEINDQIAQINVQIKQADEKKAQTQNEMNKTLDLLMDRMRASYMAGSMSELEILFSASDFSSFFTRTELLQRITEHDNDLLSVLKADVKEIEKLTKELENKNADLDRKKSELDVEINALVLKQNEQQKSKDELSQKQSSILGKVEQANNLLYTLDQSSKEFKDLIARYQREENEIDTRIDEIIRQQGSSTNDPEKESDDSEVNDDEWLWPVPYSNYYISAGYGYYNPFGTPKMHYGLDICVSGGSLGKNIVASKSGKVRTASSHPSYGNHILIDHGDGFFSLYAHCDSLLVSAGQTVKQGQVIAKIGQTGRVSGPHLHFEVRVNDGSSVNRVNPLNYVSAP